MSMLPPYIFHHRLISPAPRMHAPASADLFPPAIIFPIRESLLHPSAVIASRHDNARRCLDFAKRVSPPLLSQNFPLASRILFRQAPPGTLFRVARRRPGGLLHPGHTSLQ